MVRQALVSMVTLGTLATAAMPASARPYWHHGYCHHPVGVSIGVGPAYYGPAYYGPGYYHGYYAHPYWHRYWHGGRWGWRR